MYVLTLVLLLIEIGGTKTCRIWEKLHENEGIKTPTCPMGSWIPPPVWFDWVATKCKHFLAKSTALVFQAGPHIRPPFGSGCVLKQSFISSVKYSICWWEENQDTTRTNRKTSYKVNQEDDSVGGLELVWKPRTAAYLANQQTQYVINTTRLSLSLSVCRSNAANSDRGQSWKLRYSWCVVDFLKKPSIDGKHWLVLLFVLTWF